MPARSKKVSSTSPKPARTPSPQTSPASKAERGSAERADVKDDGPNDAAQSGGGNHHGQEHVHFEYDDDPALFDEEEMPGEQGDLDGEGSTSPAGGSSSEKQSRFAGGYNAVKSFNGQMYSGMAIGGSHTWNYQPGVWKETKVEPDLWEIDYKTNKVRNHRAPTGSGAPVGTEYHWFIVAHQMVKKVDANTYETHLVGSKYKLTHKNVNQKNWAIPTVKGQREREVFLLEDAKRRVEGLPPVLSNEKVKVDKKEKGQVTLGSFFSTSSPATTPKKRKADEAASSPANSAATKGSGAKKLKDH